MYECYLFNFQKYKMNAYIFKLEKRIVVIYKNRQSLYIYKNIKYVNTVIFSLREVSVIYF